MWGIGLADIALAVSAGIAGAILLWAIASMRDEYVSAGRPIAGPAVSRYPSETYCRVCGAHMVRRNSAVWYVARDRRRCDTGRMHIPADAPESYALIVARLGY